MKVYTIRILYKSGDAMQFECTSFEIETDFRNNKTFKWNSYGKVCPIMLGSDEITAVWQLSQREVEE